MGKFKKTNNNLLHYAKKNIPLFLRVNEFRFNLISKTKEEQFKILKSVFKEEFDNCKFKLIL